MGEGRTPVGHHVLLDLSGIDSVRLDDAAWLGEALSQAARRGGARVVDLRFSRFEPQGVSGVVVLAESHVAIHTWPELGFAALDVFTCGDPGVGDAVAAEAVKALSPSRVERRSVERGPRGGAP